MPCDGRSCYQNTLAKTVTWAVNNDGNLLHYNNIFWALASNTNQLVDSGISYINNLTAGITNYHLPSNLYLDNCQNGFTNWQTASTYCINKGMRLPSTAEALAWNSSGVPSCSSGWTWTSFNEYYDYNGNYSWQWSETTKRTSYARAGDKGYARCVK